MKRTVGAILTAISIFAVLSCNKDGDKTPATAVLGVSVKDAAGVIEIPKRQSKTFEVKLTSDPGPEEGLIVTLGANADLVEKYNAAHGTSYQMLPAEAYSLPSTPFLLPRYNKVSSLETITLKGQGCVPGETYLLPLVADKVEGGAAYEMPDDKAAYILFKMLLPEQEGEGTEDDPYILNKLSAFMKIGDMLREGETVYFKLATDIDLTDTEYSPASCEGNKKAFLDGDGHKVSNLTASIFSTLSGSVRNLVIDGAEISVSAANGGVLADIAEAGTTIRNVTVKNATLSNPGGIAGGLVGTFKGGSVEEVDVDCKVDGSQQVGGLIGRMEDGVLNGCVASGDVTSISYYSGGLVGLAIKATVKGCHASGNNVNNKSNYSRAGGLIGQFEGGLVEKSYATGDTQCAGHFGGGLIGVINGETEVRLSYATGKVILPSSGNKAGAGAFLGRLEKGPVTVSNCYSTGAVVADRWSGAFLGNTSDKNSVEITVTNCYTTSDISGITRVKGVFVGKTYTSVFTCTGFVGWNAAGDPFYGDGETVVSTTGNYLGAEGTVSSQAAALGWSTDIWDLSGDTPKLK